MAVSSSTQYVVEKSCISFCWLEILEVDFASVFPEVEFNRGRLFLCMVSLNGPQ